MEEILYLLNPWWEDKKFSIGILREKYLNQLKASLSHKRAALLIGSRRVGKTTLLYQLIDYLLKIKKIKPEQLLYVLLDHPRFKKFSISQIVKEFRALHNLDRNKKIFLFFDEVQYAKNWEQEVKALLDTENVKVFLSGSASSLIFQKSSFLTGRYSKLKIEPLDFPEFLQFKKVKISKTENYKYEKLLLDYLQIGGYPEYVLEQNPEYFVDLIEGIIFKDIVNLYKIKNPGIIRDLLLLLADRNGHQTSFTKLSKILNISVDTVREYINYIKQSFILDEIQRYSTSRSKRIYAAKKFYLNDNGLLLHLSNRFNQGAAAERTLFKFLEENYKSVNFYYEDKLEVDFIVEKMFFESKFNGDFNQQKLIKFIKDLGLKKGFVVTKSQERIIKSQAVKIELRPLWKILIENQ